MPAYDVSESFADLRGDKMQQAHEASLERKCGTCRFFAVRPPEVEIARIARPMGMCQPGSHCSGGPVRGICLKWKERGANTPQMESTQICPLYMPGGPTVLGADIAGSFQRAADAALAAENGEKRSVDGSLVALGLVGALALAGWWKQRGA